MHFLATQQRTCSSEYTNNMDFSFITALNKIIRLLQFVNILTYERIMAVRINTIDAGNS